MKDWIIIIVFIAIMIVGSVLEHNYIVETFETLGEKTQIFAQIIKENEEQLNTESVINAFDDLETYWRSHEKRLCLFLNHQIMEEPNKELSKMKIDIEYNNIHELKKSIALILNFVAGYRDYAVISLESVL
ncbi:MAG: hypothetical protein CVV59_00960 [Tenericutes bacterium HGW-Tenericutes-4]|nr:MAG: hypothetical protein CVV59_00960 [Tenericutes bacterium HGW-Tenericutes-4]